jgi:branched-chain amino acid transport system substrate-binding protein
MRKRRSLAAVATFACLTLVAAACKSNNAGGGATSGASGGKVDCNTVDFGCVTYAAGAPIRVGTLLAISGSVATLGDDSLHGVQLAIDYLDGKFDGTPGQIDGHDVTIQSEDDKCSKEGGQAGSLKLAADPTILFVVGTSCSSAALGVADKNLSDKGIILISPSNTAAGLTAEGTHQPFYLRTAQNDAIQAKVVADFVAQELGFTKAATIHDESPYAAGLTGGFKAFFETEGGTVTDEEAFTTIAGGGSSDFKPLLTSIAQTHPQLIYFPDFNPECALIAKQAAEIPQLAGVKLMGSDGCNASTFFNQAGDAANGVYLSSPIPSPGATQTGLLTQFLDAYKQQYGKPTAPFNANAFDAFNIVAQAIKKVAIQNSDGSLTIPRLALKDAVFQTKDYQGLTGSLTCISTGDCQSQAAVNIGVYQSPNVPTNPNAPSENPIYHEQFTLGQALGG